MTRRRSVIAAIAKELEQHQEKQKAELNQTVGQFLSSRRVCRYTEEEERILERFAAAEAMEAQLSESVRGSETDEN